MTIQDIIDKSITDIQRMTEKEIRSIANQLTSASNKRLRRLQRSETGTSSPAYVKERFSTKGKTRNQLIQMIKKEKDFLTSKTSTVRGWNRYRDELEKRLGGKIRKNQRKKFWRVYRKFQESHAGGLLATDKGSERIQKYIREQYIDNHVLDEDDLLDLADKKLDELYSN